MSIPCRWFFLIADHAKHELRKRYVVDCARLNRNEGRYTTRSERAHRSLMSRDRIKTVSLAPTLRSTSFVARELIGRASDAKSRIRPKTPRALNSLMLSRRTLCSRMRARAISASAGARKVQLLSPLYSRRRDSGANPPRVSAFSFEHRGMGNGRPKRVRLPDPFRSISVVQVRPPPQVGPAVAPCSDFSPLRIALISRTRRSR